MEPADKKSGSSSQYREAEYRDPTISQWVGTPVIINYSRGPSWTAQDDPFSLARGAIEGREGVFYLAEVSDFGVLVKRFLRDEGLGLDVFISWGAINAIYQLPSSEEQSKQAGV